MRPKVWRTRLVWCRLLSSSPEGRRPLLRFARNQPSFLHKIADDRRRAFLGVSIYD
jgi:hypothetical protein